MSYWHPNTTPPRALDDVLIAYGHPADPDTAVDIGYIDHRGQWWISNGARVAVIAWMALPEPPPPPERES